MNVAGDERLEPKESTADTSKNIGHGWSLEQVSPKKSMSSAGHA